MRAHHARLKELGITTAFLDLTKLGGSNLTCERYAGMLSGDRARLRPARRVSGLLGSRCHLGPMQRLFGAIREVALVKLEGSLILFVDEIDVTRSLSFSTDEFFSAIRECYVGRTQERSLQRLTFCLIGTATPSDLIQDTRVSPFNIGGGSKSATSRPKSARP